jgi:ferredoxin
MRITADPGRCIGAAQCMMTDSTVFDVSDEEYTVILRTDHAEGEQLDRVRLAVRICPSGALSLTED